MRFLFVGLAVATAGPCTQPPGGPPADLAVAADLAPPSCLLPPTACPDGHAMVGTLCSPGQPVPACTGAPDNGWGSGRFDVCLDNEPPLIWQKCKAEPCGALYFPGSDHRCDNYKGWSTVVSYGGKSYCVYKRTDSTYFNAREEIIQDCM